MFKYEISGYKYCTCGVKFTFESVKIYFRFIEIMRKSCFYLTAGTCLKRAHKLFFLLEIVKLIVSLNENTIKLFTLWLL